MRERARIRNNNKTMFLQRFLAKNERAPRVRGVAATAKKTSILIIYRAVKKGEKKPPRPFTGRDDVSCQKSTKKKNTASSVVVDSWVTKDLPGAG